MPLGVVRGPLVLPEVAVEPVVAAMVVADVTLAEPCSTMRAPTTTHDDGRLPGAIRGQRAGDGAVGGAIGTPSVTTVESRAAAQAAPAAATMVAPQGRPTEMAMDPSEGTVRASHGDGNAHRRDQSSHHSRSSSTVVAMMMTPPTPVLRATTVFDRLGHPPTSPTQLRLETPQPTIGKKQVHCTVFV